MLKSSRPRFSVVIPLYNHARYIEAALHSVLSQSRPVDQIILIDDGSSDDGFALASDLLHDVPGAIVLQQANAGAHTAINRGIELADGDFIAILNSDDVFKPTKILRCEELLVGDTDIDLLIGDVDIIDDNGHIMSAGIEVDWLHRAQGFYAENGLLLLSLLHENFAVTTSNMVFRKELWVRNGGFQALRYCHDLDFLAASLGNGKAIFDAEERHIGYRVHPTNTIKENLTKIRIEIGAVLAYVLAERGRELLSGSTADREFGALRELISAKDLSDVTLALTAVFHACGDRAAFYETVARMAAAGELASLIQSPEDQPVVASTQTQASPMTIAIEVSAFDKGGLEKVVLDSAIALKQRGFCPLIISVGPVGHLGAVAAGEGIEIIQLPLTGRSVFYAALLKARNVKLSMSHFSGVGYEVFRKLGIPNITFIHNVYAMLTGEALEKFIENDIFVDTYISVSLKATRYACYKLGVDEGKVITIANGIIVSEHEQRRKDALPMDRALLGVNDQDYIFLNVASYNLHKAHYLLAHAMKIIIKTRQDIKVVCVGNEIYPPHVQQLKHYITESGLDDYIKFPGYYADVAPLHKMSDAFILPSFIEGWSIAMNEAMFYGKPMILSDTGGSAEVIEDEDIGILIPNEYGDVLNLDAQLLDELAYSPRDYVTAPALAAAMIRFADERSAWSAAGDRARMKALERLDFERVIDQYVEVINRLIREPA